MTLEQDEVSALVSMFTGFVLINAIRAMRDKKSNVVLAVFIITLCALSFAVLSQYYDVGFTVVS